MESYPHIQKIPQSEPEWMQALIALSRFLRSPEGCPWDRKQSANSFAQFVREEAAELVEAFGEEDANEHIEEEWGDTLFTLLATMAAAESEGRFCLEHALRRAHEKMIRRHGHIFGEHTAQNPDEVVEVWRKIKEREESERQEKRRGSE
jgi:tetrapyrrole methylase family protein / MazG family protein